MYSILFVIPDFDEVLSRCVQEATRMKEYENEGNDAFTAHTKKKNFGGPRTKEKQGPKERKASVTLVTSQVTMLENALSRRILPMMMTTTTTRGIAIKGTTGATTKERGILPLLDMVMVDLPKG